MRPEWPRPQKTVLSCILVAGRQDEVSLLSATASRFEFATSSASCRVHPVRFRSVSRTTSSLGRRPCRSQAQSA